MAMQLTKIINITGSLDLLSGLHIGAGNDAMHIGGIDNPVIKHPNTQQPYIPGSSLKGKLRSLLEWYFGLVEYNQGKPISYKQLSQVSPEQVEPTKNLIKLFGVSGSDNLTEKEAREIGPSRLAFRDALISASWLEEAKEKNWLLTEAKYENSINRITGTATNPRQTERVPAGVKFNFNLQLKVLSGDDEANLVNTLLTGLKLLEQDALGGSGSRGYGRVKFNLDGELAQQLETLEPFAG